jgi:hypothetical protein
VESTYTETVRTILQKLPDTVEVPSHLAPGDLIAHAEACAPHNRRRFARRKMGHQILCQVASVLPAFPRKFSTCKAIALDLSRCGIRFLLDQQLFPEEEVLLWTLIGQIPCKVARCLKHNDRCYEIGAEIRK